MKKRMWLWCMIAALGLSLNVACSDDDDEIVPPATEGEQTPPATEGEQTPPATDGEQTPPATEGEQTPPAATIWIDTIEVPNQNLTVSYEGGEISFVTRTNQTWWLEVETESGEKWLTITDPGRAVADYTIKAFAEKNFSLQSRVATITICYDDAEDTRIEVTVTQDPRPATATIPLEIKCPNAPNYFNVAGSYNVSELIEGSDSSMEPQLGYMNEEGVFIWQDWSVTDGWFGESGPMNWGAGCIVCIKPHANGSFDFISSYPGVEAGTQITVYINYGNDVIVEVNATITTEGGSDTPEEAPEYDVVETYNHERTVVFIGNHGTVAESYTLSMAEIEEKIGGTPDKFLMSLSSGNFQDWSLSDGWFGVDGAVNWGSGSAIFCMKPKADGSFESDCCHPDIETSLPSVANCTFRYVNSSNMKAVDLVFVVNVTAQAEPTPEPTPEPEVGSDEAAEILGNWNISYTRTSMMGSATEYTGTYALTSDNPAVGGTCAYTERYTNSASGEETVKESEAEYIIEGASGDYPYTVVWFSRIFGVEHVEGSNTMVWKYLGMHGGAYASVTFSDITFTKQ